MTKLVFAVLMTVLAWLPAAVNAREVVRIESTYLGEGWFRYTIHIADDPFFLFFDATGFSLREAAGLESGPTPARWTNSPSEQGLFWSFDGNGLGDQNRPYEADFFVHSAETTFKRQQAGATLLMSLSLVGGYHGYITSDNIVGYWNLDVLVPCPSDQADGSSTNLVIRDPFGLPDIQITSLIRNGTMPVAIRYDYVEENTVRLEGTRDFATWTNIAYIYGNAGTTTWTNQALPSYGNAFRLRLVAEGHATSLPPLNPDPLLLDSNSLSGEVMSTPLIASGLRPDSRLSTVRPCIEGVQISFVTTAGRTYSVSLLDQTAKPIITVEVLATGATTKARLPCGSANLGLIQIREVTIEGDRTSISGASDSTFFRAVNEATAQ